jgi:hypothetical protein
MPASVMAALLLTVIATAGLTIAAATVLGLPVAALAFVAVVAALVLRLWLAIR